MSNIIIYNDNSVVMWSWKINLILGLPQYHLYIYVCVCVFMCVYVNLYAYVFSVQLLTFISDIYVCVHHKTKSKIVTIQNPRVEEVWVPSTCGLVEMVDQLTIVIAMG